MTKDAEKAGVLDNSASDFTVKVCTLAFLVPYIPCQRSGGHKAAQGGDMYALNCFSYVHGIDQGKSEGADGAH